MEKVTAGQDLVIKAQDFNSFIDAAEYVKQKNQARLIKTPELRGRQVMDVKLDEAYGSFEVIGVDGTTINPITDEEEYLPQFLQNIVFTGKVPEEEDLDLYGVVLTAGVEDEVVPVLIDGIVQVQIQVDDYLHEWANITDGEKFLTSNSGGSARILYKPDDEDYTEGDTVWCIVRLGAAELSYVWEATADESGGEITAKRLKSDGSLVGDEITFSVLPD